MLRITSARILQRSSYISSVTARSLVTSAQKRALNKNQLQGEAEAATTSATTTSTGANGAGSAASEVKATNGGSSGGGGMFVGGAIALLAGGAIAYQQNMLPPAITDLFEKKEESPESVKPVEEKVEATEKPVEVVESVAVDEATPEVAAPEPNRVTVEDIALAFPPKINRPTPVIPPVEHSPNAHRVSLENMNQDYPPFHARLPQEKMQEETAVVESLITEPEPTPESAPVSEPVSEPAISTTTAVEAAKELQSSSFVDSASDIHKAILLLRKDLDQSYLDDLDKLSNTELKIRLIRMVNDMSDRGRFEAVRLKEMLELKEKEIADKYVTILQQQRHQFEDLLSARLREQDDALKRQTSDLLQQKDDSIQSLLDASIDAQKAEHTADLKSKLQQLEEKLLLKKEAEYQSELASEKEKFAMELKEHVQQIQSLAKSVQNLEEVASASRTFQTSSQKAHTISAAAIALSNKLDTSEPLGAELATLRAVTAGEDTVIQATLEAIPKRAANKGIPTLSMLQRRFEHVWDMAQMAAHVPPDQVSVGAQLVGKVFSSLKYNINAVSGDNAEAKDPETILSMAKHNVESGELAKAVDLLSKLDEKSQVSFTVKDWMKEAKDRVILDKALKVVKMECALLNENMARE